MNQQIIRRLGRAFVPFVAVFAVAASMPAAAQDIKIGVVNIPKLLLTSPQFKQAKESMEAKFSKRKDELESKRERFQSDVERLKRDGSVMSQSAREKLESQLRDDQRQLKLLQEEYAEDVQLAEQKEMESIRNDIFEVIERVAKRENYDLMLAEGIIYAADTVDITEKVAAELKR